MRSALHLIVAYTVCLHYNFATYCVHGLSNTAPDGFQIPFWDGHTRRLQPDQRIFVGVIAPIDPHIETPEEVRDRSFEPGKNWRRCQEDG